MATGSQRPTPGPLPYDELREKLSSDERGRAALERLHEAVQSDAPDKATIDEHLGVLQSISSVNARIANWVEEPHTQSWLSWLTELGL